MISNARLEGALGFCVSEGLTSRALALWCAERTNTVVAYVADIGQCSRDELNPVVAELRTAGLTTSLLDLRTELAELYLDLVRYQARYEGGYWNTTGASRAVLVDRLSAAMAADGHAVLAHGSVGGGNDELRFARNLSQVRPAMTSYSPWRDPACTRQFSGRAQLAEFAVSRGLSIDADVAARSIDGNLGGFSHEGPELEALGPVGDGMRRLMSLAPQDAREKPERVAVTIEQGRPVAIDGERLDPLALLLKANLIGGRNGLGLTDVLENRLSGAKCRGVYEAPGLDLLGSAVLRLYNATVPDDQWQTLRDLSRTLGATVYGGQWFGEKAQQFRTAFDEISERASGTVTVSVYRGNIFFDGLDGVSEAHAVARETRFANGGLAWQVTHDEAIQEASSV